MVCTWRVHGLYMIPTWWQNTCYMGIHEATRLLHGDKITQHSSRVPTRFLQVPYMVSTWFLHGPEELEEKNVQGTWCVHGVYMVCTWCVHGVYMMCTWCVHGTGSMCTCLYMDCTWFVHALLSTYHAQSRFWQHGEWVVVKARVSTLPSKRSPVRIQFM